MSFEKSVFDFELKKTKLAASMFDCHFALLCAIEKQFH